MRSEIYVLALMAAAGCMRAETADAELERRELPGFSIDFPKGVLQEQRLAYSAGKLQIALSEHGGAGIEWQIGTPLSDSEYESYAIAPLRQALRLSLSDKRDVTVGSSTSARQYRLHGAEVDMYLTRWVCGRRLFSLTIGGKAPDQLDERMRKSFACTPIAAEENRRRPIPVMAGALGPDVGVFEETDEQLIVTALDGTAMTFLRSTARLDPKDAGHQIIVDKLLHAMATATNLTDLVVGRGAEERRGEVARPLWRSTAKMDDQPVRLALVQIECPAGTLLAMSLVQEPVPEARGVDLAMAARCAAPGEEPSRPPPMAEVARVACDKGDQRGCAQLQPAAAPPQ